MLPTEDQCLENLFKTQFGGKPCPKCPNGTKYYRVKNRPCFECGTCGNHIHPRHGTIMEKSRTPITKWLEAIFYMVNDKSRISANKMAVDIGVSYECAHRMMMKIREVMQNDNLDLLSGIIEVDETYVGGKIKNKRRHQRKMLHSHSNKTIVMGMVQRHGRAKFRVVEDTSGKVLNGQILEHVAKGSTIYSDENAVYKKLPKLGYNHDFITHSRGEYGRGDVTTNRIENCWMLIKNSIRGTHKRLKGKHLQTYLYEAEFQYNNRNESNLAKFFKVAKLVGFDPEMLKKLLKN